MHGRLEMTEDRRLLRRLQRGDRDALREIYEKHEGDLLTLAAHLLHDPGAAEDVVQDVFVAFVRTAPSLRLQRSLGGYLATAVANRVRDHFRREARQRPLPPGDIGRAVVDVDGPVRMVMRTEAKQRLRRAVAELPYEQREVLMLRVHADMKFREIALHQNVSIQTALSRYRYGLDKLHAMLNGEVPK
jgi:RNA polymerase sigma-70 factor (ECF subfamily)